jgi:hypothetical protein
MTDTPDTPNERRTATLEAARKVLVARFGASVRLSVRDVLRENYRSEVLRVALEDGTPDAPETAIIKAASVEEGKRFDPDDDSLGDAAWRFYNEWAGNAFLDSLGLDPPLNAGLIGGDRQAGLVILPDLGSEGKSLADPMQGTDRAALEAALLNYAASLGRLHGATAGKVDAFTSLRQQIGGRETERETEGVRWLRENVGPFRELCVTVDVELPTGFDVEIETVHRAMDEPGPFLAFAPCDTCPDNNRLTDTGYLRFFDFEFAGFRHALLDAAYFFLPYPTCWCVNRLPEEMVTRMETAYRREAVVGIPEVGEDTIYLPALAAARAYWTLATVSWGWQNTLEKDGKWGISTVRQRHLLRLGNLAKNPGAFSALGDVAGRLAEALRARWPETEEMPLYPPFRTEEKI